VTEVVLTAVLALREAQDALRASQLLEPPMSGPGLAPPVRCRSGRRPKGAVDIEDEKRVHRRSKLRGWCVHELAFAPGGSHADFLSRTRCSAAVPVVSSSAAASKVAMAR
jgi:hypothetical protein